MYVQVRDGLANIEVGDRLMFTIVLDYCNTLVRLYRYLTLYIYMHAYLLVTKL